MILYLLTLITCMNKSRIEIQRLDDRFLMEAINETGESIRMDAGTSLGGSQSAMRPMQILLASMGGCSAIDVIMILKKQRQKLRDIRISLEGDREVGVEPSLYRKIHIHFILFGEIENEKAATAVKLSMSKYCSVAKTLEATAEITYGFEIQP